MCRAELTTVFYFLGGLNGIQKSELRLTNKLEMEILSSKGFSQSCK